MCSMLPARADTIDAAWQLHPHPPPCTQDAYACSGQKCSAQSILFMHSNWTKAGLVQKMAELAGRCGAGRHVT